MTRKLSVVTRVSSLAIAAALTAAAAGQSLQGTPAVTFGSVNITEGAGSTDLDVFSTTAVIDWTPDDNLVGNFGAIAFQNSGTTATFRSSTDFAVLNRINVADDTRLIFMDGTINSLVNGVTGGSIFFYSPSGFVIGSNAVINVGSLVLSASPIAVDANGGFINGTSVTFNQGTNPNAATRLINTVAGSQINANGAGSYVALVAPEITHHGTIRTDGAAALVAAEAATINFSPDGLFDIQVTVGTDAATGILVEGGTITRNSPTEGLYDHRAYLVAVAKNDAVTMLINSGGSVGFDTATSAAIENNAVVLSGGYDVLGGDHWTTSGVSNVSLTITNATLSSDVDAQVTGGAAINSGDGALTFGGDLSIIGGETTTTGGNVLIDGLNSNPLSIVGNLYARAFRRNADGSQTGLITRLGAEGGSTVTVGGDVTLDSDSLGAAAEDFGLNGTNALGGNAQINIGANSTLNVAGSAYVHADGYGGTNFYGDGAGGDGIGGQAFLMSIFGNANVSIGGPVVVTADGYGGSAGECSVCNVTGGNGVGGSATVHTNVGTSNLMQLGSDVTISAAGFGGAGDAQAGGGFGGIANLGAADNSTLTIGADTEVDASGYGGYGFDNAGGLGLGGEARITANTNGAIDLNGPVFVTANGQGGDGGTGGTGTGGQAYISAQLSTVHAFSNVAVTANSYGGFGFTGSGGSGLADTETTTTPELTGAFLFTSGGTLTIDGLATVAANATGGDGGFQGGDGGNAVAGGDFAAIGTDSTGGAWIHAANSDAGPSVIQLGDVIVMADAQGGAGGNGQGGVNGADGGNGGSANAGIVGVTAAAGSGDLTAGATIVSASATGGGGGSGGGGDGGSGGNGGDGGQATGGFINIGTQSGNVNFAQAANNGTASYTTIIALATAQGGAGGDGGFGSPAGIAGNGGNAFGGNSVLLVRGSEVTVGDVILNASAFGGDGGLSPAAPNGDGGNATAGQVGVLVTNRFNLPLQRGTLIAGNITGFAAANGGIGGLGNGLSLSVGGNQFAVLNSDATIDSVSLFTTAAGFDSGSPDASASYIEVQNGTVDIAGGLLFQTPGSVAMWADGGTLNADQIVVDADNFIHDDTQPAPVTLGTFAANNISLTTGQDLIVDGNMVSANSLLLSAPGLVDIDSATSDTGDLFILAGSTIGAGNLTAAGFADATAPGDIAVGSINAGLDANLASSAGGAGVGNILAGGSIFLSAATGIAIGDLTAGSDVQAISGGNIDVGVIGNGDILAGGSIQLDGATGISVGSLDAGTTINLLSTAGGITTGDLDAGTFIDLEAFGDLAFGDVTADHFEFDSEASVTGGDIVAGTFAGGHGDGAVSLGDISVGILLPGGPTEDGFAVGVTSATSLNVGNVEADESIGFATLGNLNTGDLDAGVNVMTLVGGDISTGAITAAPGGRTYMADVSMYLDNGGAVDNFDPDVVLALTPVPTGGSITIGGPVSTGRFQAAAGTNLTAGAISAQQIEATAGGLMAINGTWSAPFVELWSDDLDIVASGAIDAGTGAVRLVSTNATQALIGDGVSGAGYALTNAEFGRISGGNVQIASRGDASAAIDMLIGDLTVTGPTAGSTIEDSFGTLVFATGDPDTQVAGGVIRVVGDLTASGFTADNAIEFYTGRFELDAATGLIEITGTGTDLAGELYIEADRIHVASGTILDQLATNPQYDGYQDDLNAPADVQRPDGVIRAGGIDVFPTQAVLVQNTGTAETPAGFLTVGEGPLFSQSEPPSGPIELIINGQLVTEGGLLTRVEVRDFLVDESNISLFTANSTINGCALSGDCVAGGGEGPFPPDFTPTPGIQEEITLITDDPLPPPEFGNEDFIDDNDEETEEGETSPIEPPAPLFDTSELGDPAGATGPVIGTSMRSNPGLTETGDVDDPVSGSGNPALMGTSPTPPSNEEKQP